MSDSAELIIEGKSYKLPVVIGTENEKALDIASLRAQSGYVTLDSGYKNTGATTSAITFLDGEEGILRYRGYPIEQLAEQSSFMEVAYLLLYDKLPSQVELDAFSKQVNENSALPDQVLALLNSFPQSAHPMGILASVVSSLTAFYPESIDPEQTPEQLNLNIIRLIGQISTIAAAIYKHGQGQQAKAPKAGLDYCANFLQMIFGKTGEDYPINQVVVDALNKLLILHADHEQNCSTSTVRLVGSSNASLYSSISAGILALWGPLHGGANQEVIEMLEAIKADGGDSKKWIEKAKDKNDSFRLMGFGHRVYKNFDPRARIIKAACDKILANLGVNDPALQIAKELEEAALHDAYFVDRKLYPNVDFYSGIIYKAIGLPSEMFTVMFAIGRLPGWISQWKELRDHKEPIGRPRQVYVGPKERDYVPMEKR
ncbi:MAG: citrate synthase [Adhaeribacter sp.]